MEVKQGPQFGRGVIAVAPLAILAFLWAPVSRAQTTVNLNSSMSTSAIQSAISSGGNNSIINFASMLSFLADASVPAYTASKTGLMGLTRALAHAFGPEGVRVNAIAPGYHKTDMTKPLWSQAHNHDVIARHAALKRWGTTSDLVGATVANQSTP